MNICRKGMQYLLYHERHRRARCPRKNPAKLRKNFPNSAGIFPLTFADAREDGVIPPLGSTDRPDAKHRLNG
ncbi:MAG: hypothetical protein IJC15_07110 [Clostridia bacterium]|nr:hypothetical protein [Clostridia bacterium]